LLVCFCFSGCLEINRYTSKVYPIRDENEIEVYSFSLPKKEYIEIAEILSSSASVYKLKKEASKLGADAIIIVGPASIDEHSSGSIIGSIPIVGGMLSGFSNFITTRSSVTKENGRKAVAIKYVNL
jgi:hypothetical protein